MQTLIEQEVCSALKKNETKLQSLIGTIQQLDHGVDYESSIQKLEVDRSSGAYVELTVCCFTHGFLTTNNLLFVFLYVLFNGCACAS